MTKARLEAFSDGVLAIIITIMVLELRPPHGISFSDLSSMCSSFLAYTLSFIFIGIYWNNHHHLFQAVQKVSGPVLWANLHLLFWLSLVPFATAWIGEKGYAFLPVATYGLVLICSGLAYYILAKLLVRLHGKDSTVGVALGSDFKGKISVVIYALGIGTCFFIPWLGYVFYLAVALMWLVPDRRIEKVLIP